MTLTKLLIYVGIAAILLTLAIGFGYKRHKNWAMTFLQNYCGCLFLFSGWVKAVDPMGTAFKMDDYFAAFKYTFDETWFSFISPLFEFLSSIKVEFSVAVIVFEIVLGVLLITGSKSKFAVWSFLFVVAFFTALTGFTYLTGYVPPDANFFQFADWGSFKESNMQVTDCGCFGDFLKLKPKTSFLKDVALMFPALYFVFRHKDMHELFTSKVRTGLAIATTIGIFIYCLSNFVWDIPHADFRPFKKGINVADEKEAQLSALSAVPILFYEITNKETSEKIKLPYDQYLKEFKNYPKEKFNLEQILGEPTVAQTKIANYHIQLIDSYENTEELLQDEKPSIMLVSYTMKGKGEKAVRMLKDTIYVQDTIQVSLDSLRISNTISDIIEREESYVDYTWDKDFLSDYRDVVGPFARAAQADGFHVYSVMGGADDNMVDQLKEDANLDFDFYTADAILLKTIIRSNPGIVLWKKGQILDKWHVSKLPSYEEVKSKYQLQ